MPAAWSNLVYSWRVSQLWCWSGDLSYQGIRYHGKYSFVGWHVHYTVSLYRALKSKCFAIRFMKKGNTPPPHRVYSHTWVGREIPWWWPLFLRLLIWLGPYFKLIIIWLTPSFCSKNWFVSITFSSRDTWT